MFVKTLRVNSVKVCGVKTFLMTLTLFHLIPFPLQLRSSPSLALNETIYRYFIPDFTNVVRRFNSFYRNELSHSILDINYSEPEREMRVINACSEVLVCSGHPLNLVNFQHDYWICATNFSPLECHVFFLSLDRTKRKCNLSCPAEKKTFFLSDSSVIKKASLECLISIILFPPDFLLFRFRRGFKQFFRCCPFVHVGPEVLTRREVVTSRYSCTGSPDHHRIVRNGKSTREKVSISQTEA